MFLSDLIQRPLELRFLYNDAIPFRYYQLSSMQADYFIALWIKSKKNKESCWRHLVSPTYKYVLCDRISLRLVVLNWSMLET